MGCDPATEPVVTAEVEDIGSYLETLIARVAEDLINTYSRSHRPSEHGLIFPKRRDGLLRISEQEAKLLFIQHLTLDRRFCFSVETPTSQTYRQKGASYMSARIDLTLFWQGNCVA